MSDIIRGEKSPGTAVMLNLCVPFIGFGLGYFYIGQSTKGILTIISNFLGVEKGGAIGQFTFFSTAADPAFATQPPPVPPPQPAYHQPPPPPSSASGDVSKVVKDAGKEIGTLIDKAKSSSGKKVCLSCGQQVDLRYSVCPFCQGPTGGSSVPKETVVEY